MNFPTRCDATGEKKGDMNDEGLMMLAKMGMTTANDVIDGLFKGLRDGDRYIIVDHPLDVPTISQIKLRMEDQMQKRRPRSPEQLAMILAISPDKQAAFKERKKTMAGKSKL